MNSCRIRFPRFELFQFGAAAILLTAMFLVAYQWDILVAAGIGAFGLLAHELAHKFAGRYHCIENVHFVVSPIGIAIGFASAFFIGHALAAPGGVTVGRNADKKSRFWMSVAGPLANVLLFIVFYGAGVIWYIPYDVAGATINILHAVAYVNLYLAIFNLIPIAPLDGGKAFENWKIGWIVTFLGVAILVAMVWTGFPRHLYPLFDATWGGIFKVLGGPVAFGVILNDYEQVHLPDVFAYGVLDREAIRL